MNITRQVARTAEGSSEAIHDGNGSRRALPGDGKGDKKDLQRVRREAISELCMAASILGGTLKGFLFTANCAVVVCALVSAYLREIALKLRACT